MFPKKEKEKKKRLSTKKGGERENRQGNENQRKKTERPGEKTVAINQPTYQGPPGLSYIHLLPFSASMCDVGRNYQSTGTPKIFFLKKEKSGFPLCTSRPLDILLDTPPPPSSPNLPPVSAYIQSIYLLTYIPIIITSYLSTYWHISTYTHIAICLYTYILRRYLTT